MGDERPVETLEEAVVRLTQELTDLRTTTNAWLNRCPTGDIEPTLRTTPKANTLILNGQTVSRTTYAVLWQWVQDQGLVAGGLFTVGDGTTTFGLPNLAGRCLVGVDTGEPVGTLLGNDTITLSIANLPSHGHSVSINGIGDHGHNFGTGGGGQHEGHFNTSVTNTNNGTGVILGLAAWNAATTWRGDHTHGGGVDLSGNHTHGVNQSNVGSGTAIDVRSRSLTVNWLIWT